MRWRKPRIRASIGNDKWLHIERRAQLPLHFVPHTIKMFLSQNTAEIRMGSTQQTVIGIELAIGEPEAIIGTRIEPTGMIVFGTILEDC